MIGYNFNCRALIIIDGLNSNFPYVTEIRNYLFNQQILESIQENKAIAATDALVKGRLMGELWLIMMREKV